MRSIQWAVYSRRALTAGKALSLPTYLLACFALIFLMISACPTSMLRYCSCVVARSSSCHACDQDRKVSQSSESEALGLS